MIFHKPQKLMYFNRTNKGCVSNYIEPKNAITLKLYLIICYSTMYLLRHEYVYIFIIHIYINDIYMHILFPLKIIDWVGKLS